MRLSFLSTLLISSTALLLQPSYATPEKEESQLTQTPSQVIRASQSPSPSDCSDLEIKLGLNTSIGLNLQHKIEKSLVVTVPNFPLIEGIFSEELLSALLKENNVDLSIITSGQAKEVPLTEEQKQHFVAFFKEEHGEDHGQGLENALRSCSSISLKVESKDYKLLVATIPNFGQLTEKIEPGEISTLTGILKQFGIDANKVMSGEATEMTVTKDIKDFLLASFSKKEKEPTHNTPPLPPRSNTQSQILTQEQSPLEKALASHRVVNLKFTNKQLVATIPNFDAIVVEIPVGDPLYAELSQVLIGSIGTIVQVRNFMTSGRQEEIALTPQLKAFLLKQKK